VGVLLIAGAYFITFFKIRPFNKGKALKRNNYTIMVLFFIVSVCLTGFFAWSHKRYFNEEFPIIDSGKDRRSKKISQVILIVLDTVRADRLSIYGGPVATKNMEAFSRDALIFENCVTPSPWTLPSHASLFTGLYPTEHGSHYHLDSKKKTWLGFLLPHYLSEEFLTLAEIFRDSDYKTCAVASNYSLLSPDFKMDQGFQYFDNRENIGKVYVRHPFRPIIHLFCNLTNIYPKYILSFRSADDITRECLHMLESLAASPFFLFVNYMDAHDPYRPPSPFNGYFLDTSFPRLYRLKQYFLRFSLRFTQRWWNGKLWDSYQLSQYDGEIAYLDDELGSFFSRLKKMGIYDSSLIIVTADHGELFGENGIYGHECIMYEGVVKVPLMIKFPYGGRVGREKKMITLADLYPTILSICGLTLPNGISGKAFGDDSLPIVAELYKKGIGEHRVLYEGKYKFMNCKYERKPELYDLDRDPMEKENLAGTLPEIALLMGEKLKEWEKEHNPKYMPSAEKEREDILSREIRDGLKALGYIQ
jgi:arylsulfatase A-like enzyme